MRSIRLLKNFVLIIMMFSWLFTGCVKDEFDIPPVNIPSFTLPEGATLISIRALKARHTMGQLDSINDEVYIRGVVTGNDQYGNIYKTLIIQDDSAGIEIKLNKTNLYNDYKLGQLIYVKCKGLFLGDYNGLTQLGSIYNQGIGQIAEINIKAHLFKDGLPGAVPAPILINNASELNTGFISMLVRFDGAKFEEGGQPYVASGEDNTNRTLTIPGGTITVRTSKYAAFATSLMPTGLGTVIAILGYYNGTYQLTIRNTTDVFGFVPDPNVKLLDEKFDTDPGWAAYSVSSNKNWTYSSQYQCMVANNYGADAPADDWLFTPEIDLTGLDSATLSFRTWSKYSDAGQPNSLQVMISDNYIIGNNPTLSTWTLLTATLCPFTSTWTASGNIDITAFVNKKVRIAWRYRSSGTGSGSAAQWEVDGVLVKGKKHQ